MSSLLIILIFIKFTSSYYLESSANYLKPQMERNNIVNKKIWVRNKPDGTSESDRRRLGSFIFRPETMDVGFLQNAFDFIDNTPQDTPMITGYVQRARRSPEHTSNTINNSKAKTISTTIENAIINSKIVSELKPASIFNEYPYAVALLLNNAEKDNIQNLKKNIVNDKNNTKDYLKEKTDSKNATRRKKYDLKSLSKYFDVTNDTKGDKRSVIDKEIIWNENNAILSDTNKYKVVKNHPIDKTKGVTERGLVKIIAMLTRSFKRITKHYKEIMAVHNHILKITKDFDKKASQILMKFDDFESKYADMIHFNNKINEIGAKMDTAQEYLQNKYKNIEDTFNEFRNQQNTFLGQQQQFFKLQKVIADQNEKINRKQNEIAKVQSEISHRQNNFARILKKAKQVFIDKKVNATNISSTPKLDNNIISTTESMKINLFSIPTKNKLQNQDDLIIKEKDEKQIDDLIYKYYFNNTYIDNFMKSKILNFANGQNLDVRQGKSKRNDMKTTIMWPVKKNSTDKLRSKRWTNYFGKKYKRMHLDKIKKSKDTKIYKVDTDHDPFEAMATSFCKEIGKSGNDQSLKWCVEKSLRKLKTMEMMTYSPLKVTIMSEKARQITHTDSITGRQLADGITTHRPVPSTVIYTEDLAPVTQALPYTSMYPSTSIQNIYFPDNDELESNLKQYEIKPDTEGNVYYDGSVHISDFGRMINDDEIEELLNFFMLNCVDIPYMSTNSEDTSDIIPGLMDSNSKVDIDPIAFDLQAQRRAYVNRLNENILKKMRL